MHDRKHTKKNKQKKQQWGLQYNIRLQDDPCVHVYCWIATLKSNFVQKKHHSMSGIWQTIRYPDFINIAISVVENPLGKIVNI